MYLSRSAITSAIKNKQEPPQSHHRAFPGDFSYLANQRCLMRGFREGSTEQDQVAEQ